MSGFLRAMCPQFPNAFESPIKMISQRPHLWAPPLCVCGIHCVRCLLTSSSPHTSTTNRLSPLLDFMQERLCTKQLNVCSTLNAESVRQQWQYMWIREHDFLEMVLSQKERKNTFMTGCQTCWLFVELICCLGELSMEIPKSEIKRETGRVSCCGQPNHKVFWPRFLWLPRPLTSCVELHETCLAVW